MKQLAVTIKSVAFIIILFSLVLIPFLASVSGAFDLNNTAQSNYSQITIIDYVAPMNISVNSPAGENFPLNRTVFNDQNGDGLRTTDEPVLSSGIIALRQNDTLNASVETLKSFSWSGYNWFIKEGFGGPGNNYWGASDSNVWVDSNGDLHLRIYEDVSGKWNCAEIWTNELLPFGKYLFWIDGPIDKLDENVVFGMFSYPEAGPDETNEIDIEIAQFWSPGDYPIQCPLGCCKGGYTVWPNVEGTNKKYTDPFCFSLTGNYTTHRYIWRNNQIHFQSLHGFRDWNDNANEIHNSVTPSDYGQYISKKPMPIHINLWLRNETAPPYNPMHPTDGNPVEIVIKKFTYIGSDFEENDINTLPMDFKIYYSGKGTTYQIVTADQAHSGSKSLQVWGTNGYCANVHYYFDKPDSGRIGYDVWVKANPKEEGVVQFVNPEGGPWTWGWGGIAFNQDGNITAPGGYKKLHTEDKWYKVKAEMDVITGACWVWLDDELVTNGITPAQDGVANPDAFKGIRGITLVDCSWNENPSTPTYFDDFMFYVVESNRPPNIPVMPSGPSSGNSLTSYTYTTSASDPDSDQVKYIFDWGDEATDETILVNSGSSASKSHFWWNAGTYEIKAKAIDSKGEESAWSSPVSVTISEATWSCRGGYIISKPFIIKDDQDRTHIFVKGGDNALWDNVDGNWRCLGGIITSDPYAVKDNQGRIHILVRGGDFSLWDLILDTTANTNQWLGLGGVITSNPTAATFSGNNYLKVAVKGGDNSLWMRIVDTVSLQPISWTPLGGYITSHPGIICDSQGKTHILVKGGDNALWDNVDGNWRCLGGIITSDPKSLEADVGDFSTPHKEILTFVRGSDGGLWINSLNPISNSNQWIGLGGFISPTKQDPEPIIDNRQDVRIYVIGGDGSMWENRYDRYYHTGTWNPFGGLITSNPSAITYVDNDWHLWTDVAVSGGDNALWVRTVPGGSIL